jgi:hypothetical protein
VKESMSNFQLPGFGQGSVGSIAISYGMDGRGSIPGGGENLRIRPYQVSDTTGAGSLSWG